jgi:hypothetical protein
MCPQLEMLYLLKTSRDLQMMFAAVMHLVEGLSSETLLTLRVEKSLFFLVGARSSVNIVLKTSIRNKTSRFCCLE